ncbi:MAG: amino acid permease [Candidatus Marinimicrobia bacterium]|nr:amino acid permease [Candidatus Neomarinimicrobiota bacterium]MCF7839869.1 amino acid permease [Candidatus Neomarinimicrobiota bacterium]MCF7902261.1 amino acid permease [Candidatus Neomarinimicrobiota bacterium]
MALAKKFGTFGGVFTPAILTILGVIMYMRLPQIVGQAGLLATIGIILVAHIISITTGLSVSSIATDKKVKAGGTYYMISRSLGLPIGGTLGLALFVGLSFSVSLYVIGFSESFINFWGWETNKNTIRLVGSVVLIAVTTVTFISTALAIKTQYFIMAAIVLSLVSIFMGTHGTDAMPHVTLPQTAVPLVVLFAIYFPAVTGFEAGVSMSGDLKDPKRSIPVGTISAIVVGLVVYIFMAAFFAYRVDPYELVNNPNILLDMSFFPPVVLAGIWGATISSSFGSILGAPRILQAVSADKITPRIFAKGKGKENEPRNALLLTFIIAETGVLMGELDVIARVVTMFFIVTYGFLNTSCAIESWASPDFRPDFKIPKVVSIIGALAAFLVMIQIDFVAMIGATLILGALFFYLKRKELTLESGDTWEGVWSSLVRTALHRLRQRKIHQRNWRPNIILFSGGRGARPHLVELGRWLVNRRGILSDFKLIENPKVSSMVIRDRHDVINQHPDANGTESFMGRFIRQVETNDVYACMEDIVKFYGFASMDPNSVLLGWARNSREPEKFIGVLETLQQMDYNILLLDHDEDTGFGTRERVDIWWRGGGNNISLALALIRFLAATDEWREAKIRLLIVNEDESAIRETIMKHTHNILEEYRIDAEVKVINNAIEKRDFLDIVRVESAHADLTITGIPPLNTRDPLQYVAFVNKLADDLGAVLLIHASQFFQDLYVGIEMKGQTAPDEVQVLASETPTLPTVNLPEAEVTAGSMERLVATLDELNIRFTDQHLKKVLNYQQELVEQFQELVERSFEALERNFSKDARLRNRRAMLRVQSDFLYQSQRLLSEFRQTDLELQKAALADGLEHHRYELFELILSQPETIVLEFSREEFKATKSDGFRSRQYKFWKRLGAKITRKPVFHRMKFRTMVKGHMVNQYDPVLLGVLERFGMYSYQIVSDMQKCVNHIRESFGKLENRILSGEGFPVAVLEEQRTVANAESSELTRQLENHQQLIRHLLLKQSREIMVGLSQVVNRVDANHQLPKKFKITAHAEGVGEKLNDVPLHWHNNQALFLDMAILDIQLLSLQNRLGTIVERMQDEVMLSIQNTILDELTTLRDGLTAMLAPVDGENSRLQLSSDTPNPVDPAGVMGELLSEIRLATNDLPESVEVISETALNELETNQFDEQEMLTVALRRLTEFIVESEFLGPLQEQMNQLPHGFQAAQTVAQDVLRLAAFDLTEAEGDETLPHMGESETREKILTNGVQRLEKEIDHITQVQNELAEFVQHQFKKTREQLNPYNIVHSAEDYQQYIRDKRTRGVVTRFQRMKQQVERYTSKRFVRLLYRRSEGVLFARRLQTGARVEPTISDKLLNILEQISPKPAVLNSLPFYYKQLFLGKPGITNDFWIGRETELEMAARAVERFNRGFGGALFIVGEEHMGKSALAQFAARKHFDKDHIFTVTPPESGSISVEEFIKHLQVATRATGDLNHLMGRLTRGHALIFNDVELWWERSGEGQAVLNEILDIIRTFGRQVFIILNLNRYAYNALAPLYDFQELALSMIECQPYDAEDLKNIILLRHRSTGLQFVWEGTPEAELSEWKMAKLFTRLFDYSHGNVGLALRAWIAAIQKVEKGRLILELPSEPDLSALRELDVESIAFLLQFILHKRLTREKIGRITRWQEDDIRNQFQFLENSGVIQKQGQGAWVINPYLESFIIRHLKSRGYL